MKFVSTIPTHPLNQFIESMWFYEGFNPGFTKEKILPDGAIEFMIDLTDIPKKLFVDNDLNRYCLYRNAWISGERTGYIMIEQQPCNGSMLGVRFRPGGAYPFFSFPISEINDSVVELDLIYGAVILDLREQLIEASSIAEKFGCVESFLINQARRNLEPDQAVEFAIRQILTSPKSLAIRDLADMIGITQKHLIAKFDNVVGLTPKLLSRIAKFQKVIQTIGHQKQVEWSEIVHGCGYFDQSHFIKDFVHFSGMNPSRYLVERGQYLNTISIKD